MSGEWGCAGGVRGRELASEVGVCDGWEPAGMHGVLGSKLRPVT